MFTVNIKTENAAFKDMAGEVARILRDIADQVENGATRGRPVNSNENEAGQFYFDSDDGYEEVI